MIIKSTDLEKLNNDQSYQNFLNDNPGIGTLKIRATSASEAIPINNVLITVSKEIGNNTIIFFEGRTDESGMINGIKLPTPVRVESDEDVPKFTTYQLRAVYSNNSFDKTYDISLCCGVGVIQYINITPDIKAEVRNSYGY
ncbi:MAG: hypothetical protein IKO49_03170 [Bacilli bacterium]|nr:hypothetical protein [Bacilli bacterium]